MKQTLTLTLGLVCASIFAQNSTQDFQAASKLLARYKYADAEAAFGKLADREKGAMQDKARLYQAISLARQRKTDDGLKAAEKIADPVLKAFAEMNVYSNSRKSQMIFEKYGKVDFSKWPEDIAYKAFYLRGNAYGRNRQPDKAIADFRKSYELAGADDEGKLLALMDHTDVAFNAKKYDEALAASEKALPYKTKFGTSYLYLRPAFIRAEIFIRQKNLAEAEALLTVFPEKNACRVDYWSWKYDMLHGDIELARGNKEKAEEWFRKALKAAGDKGYLVKPTQKKLSGF